MMMKPRSVSQILHEDLHILIQNTPPGGKLPSEPILAESLHVSRATLREAMRTFEAQGKIYRRQGSGTYVTHPSKVITTGLEILESIDTLATRIGFSVKMSSCNIVLRDSSMEEMNALKLTQDLQVVSIDRVMIAENRPVAYLVDVLPANIMDINELKNAFNGSVLDYLLNQGQPSLDVSQTEISAVTATSDIAKRLNIQRGDVLLCFNALLFSIQNQVVDYSLSYYLPGYFRFHIHRNIGRR